VRSNELGLEVSDKVMELLAAQECRFTEKQVDAVMAHYTSKKVAKVSQGAGATSALLATLLKGGEVARALTFVENMSQSGTFTVGKHKIDYSNANTSQSTAIHRRYTVRKESINSYSQDVYGQKRVNQQLFTGRIRSEKSQSTAYHSCRYSGSNIC
jgi:hypothetical protein